MKKIKTNAAFNESTSSEDEGNKTAKAFSSKSMYSSESIHPVKESAEEEYHYDAYHQTKTVLKQKSSQPKYIHNILAAADRRKADRQRLQLKTIQAQRLKEGLDDTEQFVTTAYKQAMQDMSEEEINTNTNTNTNASANTSYFTTLRAIHLLDDNKVKATNSQTTANQTNNQINNEINNQSAVINSTVTTNAQDEIIDKRQLLAAGLNVTRNPPPQKQPPQKQHINITHQPNKYKSSNIQKQHQTYKNNKRLKETNDNESIKVVFAKTSTQETVSNAKERYLDRMKLKSNTFSDSE